MGVLLLSRKDVDELVSIEEVIEVVEMAFGAKGQNRTQMPPKTYIFLEKYEGDIRVMPASLEDPEAAGVKVVNVHPRNPGRYRLPTVMATILLLDPATGSPLAIMDGTLITKMRTGAAAAVATKYLARRNSKSVAMIGAGAQARAQLVALSKVLEVAEVKVEDVVPGKAEKYAEEFSDRLGIDIEPVTTTEEAVRGADVVVTVTPRRSPVVMNEWIKPGTHINAIGADAPGKQELDPRILKRAKVVVDDWEQAIHSGEVNVPLSEGFLSRDDIYADIGEVVSGKKPGRTSDEEITVFDSTGLAIQDVAVAWHVYKKAKERGAGSEVELF